MARFAELAYAETPIGEISLRRRIDPQLDREVFEVKLGDEFLMSSLFTVAEIELARLGLAAHDGDPLDVAVGGLGLGYTAVAALDDARVRRLDVIETVGPVIDWHQRGLLPDASRLTDDPRCSFEHDDFFARVAEQRSPRHYDVVLLDVDHSPRHVLHPTHAAFYEVDGLRRLSSMLRSDGVFALWSDDPPDADFVAVLGDCFEETRSHEVTFANPLTRGTSSNTVYVARRLRD